MRFRHPIDSIEFDIPDSWWMEAKAHLFSRSASSFAATSNPDWPTELVPIENVTAPQRLPGTVGLHKERTISLIQAITSGCAVPPLEVYFPPQTVRLAVRDGYHRYLISVALGFTMLPVSIRPYFDFNAL